MSSLTGYPSSTQYTFSKIYGYKPVFYSKIDKSGVKLVFRDFTKINVQRAKNLSSSKQTI